jgi:molybdopterin converting factor small subunit
MDLPAHPGGSAILVRALFFGPLAESIGEREVEIALPIDAKLIDLISRLNLEDLVSKGLRVAIDGNISSDFGITLEDYSEVAFLPPVSGG